MDLHVPHHDRRPQTRVAFAQVDADVDALADLCRDQRPDEPRVLGHVRWIHRLLGRWAAPHRVPQRLPVEFHGDPILGRQVVEIDLQFQRRVLVHVLVHADVEPRTAPTRVRSRSTGTSPRSRSSRSAP